MLLYSLYRTIDCLRVSHPTHPEPYPHRCTLAHKYNPTSVQDADESEALQVHVKSLQTPFDVRRQRCVRS